MNELQKILLLLFISALLAITNAYVQDVPLVTPPPATIDKKLEIMKEKVPQGITIVSHELFFEIVNHQSKRIIDARTKNKFLAGHIEGAVNIPEADVAKASESFMNQYGPDTPIVVYCDGPDCMASIKVASFFQDYGYSEVSIYLDGYETWIKK